MDDEDRLHLEKLLRTHKGRLRSLEQQEANMGPRTPPEILSEIDDVRKRISDITATLSNGGSERIKETNSLPPNLLLSLLNEDNIQFRYAGGHRGAPQSFEFALNLYIENATGGPIILQNISSLTAINNVVDAFLIKRIGVAFRVSRPIKGSLLVEKSWIVIAKSEIIELPLTIKKGEETPFTLFFRMDAGVSLLENLVETYTWVKTINVTVTCKFSGRKFSKEESINLSIECSQLHRIFEQVAAEYQANKKDDDW